MFQTSHLNFQSSSQHPNFYIPRNSNQPSIPATTFDRFPLLPKEIRVIIRKEALFGDKLNFIQVQAVAVRKTEPNQNRIRHVSFEEVNQNVLMEVCAESRRVLRRGKKQILGGLDHKGSIAFNPKLDTIYYPVEQYNFYIMKEYSDFEFFRNSFKDIRKFAIPWETFFDSPVLALFRSLNHLEVIFILLEVGANGWAYKNSTTIKAAKSGRTIDFEPRAARKLVGCETCLEKIPTRILERGISRREFEDLYDVQCAISYYSREVYNNGKFLNAFAGRKDSIPQIKVISEKHTWSVYENRFSYAKDLWRSLHARHPSLHHCRCLGGPV